MGLSERLTTYLKVEIIAKIVYLIVSRTCRRSKMRFALL